MTKKNSSVRCTDTKETMAGASSAAAAAAPTTFTREWVLNNPDAFRKLSTPPLECPICMEPFGPGKAPLGPIMGDTPTSCRHFMCKTCWLSIVEKSQTSPFHCPICREDVSNWLAGVLREHLKTDSEVIDARKALKDFMGKSIMLALQFGDLELATAGTKIFAMMWSMDDLTGIRYENPLWRATVGRPASNS